MKYEFYRNDLLQTAFDAKNLSLAKIYDETGIAINTQRAALSGQNIQIDKLKIIADFLGVKWFSLFNINDKKDGEK